MYHKQKIHMIGIGGSGMSGIAEVLLNLGYPVSGSDLKSSNVTRRLKKRAAKINYGHKKDYLEDADVVVVSSAIRKSNPEYQEAQKRGIPLIQRAEMLAELMRFSKHGIAVSGTHGKTTTTSLIASLLYHGTYDPTMIIGGIVNSFRSNARLGKGDFMVAEADESDGSFLKLSPSVIVITGIDPEHMDFYKNFDEVREAYLKFVQRLPFYGTVVACVDHPEVRRLLKRIDKKVITYGLSKEADFSASHIEMDHGGTHFDLMVSGEKKTRFSHTLIGKHNILNSLAAIAVCQELGMPLKKIKPALKKFKGIKRRCEILYQNDDYTIIDDYGHHPEEIKVTLKGIRQAFKGRLVTLFQPHRYSRTKELFEDFVNSFGETNLLIVTDIYSAGEKAIEGVSSKKLVEALKKNQGEQVFYKSKSKNLAQDILKLLEPGDLFLSLGAGDVTKVGHDLAKILKKKRSSS